MNVASRVGCTPSRGKVSTVYFFFRAAILGVFHTHVEDNQSENANSPYVGTHKYAGAALPFLETAKTVCVNIWFSKFSFSRTRTSGIYI